MSEAGGGRVVVVRHGETEWSLSGRHTSRTDLPLLDRGRVRAGELGPLLRGLAPVGYAVVLTSPLRRARETCELAGFSDLAEQADALREWGYGEYEGMTTAEIRSERPDWDLWRDGCPGGEAPVQVQARALAVIERCRAGGGDSLLFAHGHILRVIAACWIELGVARGARLTLRAGGVGVLGYERATRVVAGWNV